MINVTKIRILGCLSFLFCLATACTTDNPDYGIPGDDGTEDNQVGAAPRIGTTSDGGANEDASLGIGPSPEDGSSDGTAGDLLCVPQKLACGRCGTRTGVCTNGTLTHGACEGEGVCTPGESYGSMDGCSVRTCTKDCAWDLWRHLPDASCSTGSVRSCNAGLSCSHAGKQVCVACRWGSCTCN